MAIITANSSLQLGYNKGISSASSLLINSPSTGAALPFVADFTGNITRVALFTGDVTVYTTRPFTSTYYISTDITNLDVGIMESNVTKDLPSDTFLATPNTISIVAGPPPLYYTINLDNAVPVVKGNVYWIAYKPNASFTGTLVMTISSFFPYVYNGLWRIARRTSSAWSRFGSSAHVMYGSDTRWYSNNVPIHPVSRSIGPLVSDKEYGFSFILKSDHPAIRVTSIILESVVNIELISNMAITCKVRSQAGNLLYTFQTYNTNNLSLAGNLQFDGNDLWLESNTKYYIMLAFNGTFTSDVFFINYIYNPIWNNDEPFTSNVAERLSDGTITENTERYALFKIFVDSVRFDDTQKDIYINASPMFSGGFSG
jgi:hypothetical protein